MADVRQNDLDYCLKCTRGIFEGRFLFVNRGGELFGSDVQDESITMLIENAAL